MDAALEVLGDYSQIASKLWADSVFSRGLPKDDLQEKSDIKNVFCEVLLNNYVEGTWESHNGHKVQVNPAVDICSRNGWLQAELNPGTQDTVFVFPSILHRR